MTNVAKKKQLPAFLVLTIIAVIAALVLAATNEVTKGPIAAHAAAERNKAFAAVLPAASYEEQEIPEGHAAVTGLYAAVDASGAPAGYTVVAAASGYAGPVAVTLGVGPDGMVTGAVIGDTSFAETAGFGMRWKEETNRWEQFQLIDTANGGSIEAISGATVTSNAVLSATNAAINCVNEVRGVAARDVVSKGTPAAKPIETMELTGGIHEGSAKGFASDVRVQLTMDDANVVTGLVIDSTGETAGFGTRAMEEPEFAKQFVGKTAPFELGKNIDALTGATVTSTAVVAAVNAACEAPVNPDAVPFDLGGEEEPAVEASTEPVAEGAKTASAPGFMGNDVGVTVTFNEDGTIATLDFDLSKQMAPNCDLVNTDAYKANFIGKKGPFEVDAVATATYTSKGIVEALNSLFPAEEAAAAEVLTASAAGFMSNPVTVNVTLNEDGTIATLDFDLSKQMAPNCDLVNTDEYKANFIGKKGPFEVDAVATATYTSKGIVEALNSLFPAEAPAEEDTEALTASAAGFMNNPVTVNVTLNEDGTIATLDFDLSEQMAPNCDLVNTDEYKANFIGKKGPFEVDAVATATYTSKGIVEALNSLFPAEEAAAAEALSASAAGFMNNPVTVNVTLNEDGTIATLDFDLSEQMAPNCDLVNTDEYKANFIGKKGPFEVDAVATATYTSKGIVEALNSLFPAEAPTEEATEALTAKGTGFMSNPVTVTVTLNEDGTIATLDFDLSKQMAPNCDLVNTDEYKANFIGKKGPFEVDAVATATYTSKGVVEALNSLFPAEEAAATDVLTASAAGFMNNPVTVTVTLNEDGTIATLDFDLSEQMAPNCDLVNTDAYKANFIGKKGPFEVDAVATATYTSKGIVEALNSLFPAEAPVEETTEALTAKGTGFMSNPVTVNVTLNEDGTIATLDFDLSEQMAPNCDLVNTDAYKANFIGKKGPFEVDAVATATYTSKGIVEALNSLFPAETPVEEAPAANEMIASAPGFMGNDVTVKMTLNEDGTIATLDFDLSKQMAPNCDLVNTDAYKANFIGKKGPFEVDAVATATYTSKGIVEALNSMFPTQDMSVTGE